MCLQFFFPIFLQCLRRSSTTVYQLCHKSLSTGSRLLHKLLLMTGGKIMRYVFFYLRESAGNNNLFKHFFYHIFFASKYILNKKRNVPCILPCAFQQVHSFPYIAKYVHYVTYIRLPDALFYFNQLPKN